MKPASLIACPGCARHVRVGEAACPFCKASLAEATQAFAARVAPRERLSRSALYAFGVGSLTVATACGGNVTTTTLPDAGTRHADAGDQGAPPDAGFDVGTATLYGGFFVPDAGEDDAGGEDGGEDAASDAADVADVGVAVPYGVPVMK